MNDLSKTKKTLIQELVSSRQRIADLEKVQGTYRETEKALRESEEMYRMLVETSPDAILMYGIDGTILAVNKELVRKYGAESASEFHREIKSVFDLLEANGRSFAAENFKRTIAQGASQQNEYQVRLRDGKHLSVEINSSVVRTADGKPRAFISVVRDISERKQAEGVLRESEEKYRRLIETTQTGFVIIDQDGFVLDANPEYVRLTGYHNLSEIVGRKVIEWTADHEKEKNATAVGECFGKGYIRNLKIDYVDSRGNITPIEINATRIESGGVAQILTLCRDITDRMQMEKALLESEERFRSLIQSLSDMIFVIDRNGQLTYESPSVSRILGFQPGYFIGKSPFTHIHPDDLDTVVKDLDEVVWAVNPGLPTEFRYRKADNTWVYLEALGSNYYDTQGIQGIVITARDISERKRVEDALRKSEAEKTVILESVPDMIFCIDTDMRVIYSNLAMEKFFNLTSKLLEGNVCYSVLHHRDEPCPVCPALSAMQSGKPHESYVSSFGRHWLLSGCPVRDESGAIVGAIEVVSDITDLRNAEEKYRSIFDNAMEGIYQSAPDGHLLSANPALARIFGYDSPESMMRIVTSVTQSLYVDPERRKAFLRLVEEQGIAQNFEFEGLKENGERIHISDNARAVRDKKGNTLYYEGIIQDITDRKHAEEALRESEEIYRSVFKDHAAIKLLIDPETGSIVEANNAALEYYGWSYDQIKQMTIQEINILPPEDVRKEMEKALMDKRIHFEFRHRRADGSIRDVEVYSSKIRLKGKAFLHSIIHDSSERKRMEDSLRKSEQRFRILSENAPDIIYSLHPDGAISYVNPSWKRLLGHDEEEVLGRFFIDFAREQDRRTYRKLFKSLRDDGKVVRNYIGVVLDKDGAERVFNMNSAFNRDSEGKIISFVGTMTDITEQRELEKKLSHAQKMESIGTLAGGIAHDFNNLLMGIQGYASLTLLDLDPSHPHYQRLKRIEEQVQSGADLTRQLLGFARGGRYEVKPADMNDIIKKTSSMFGRTKKEIIIHRKYEKDLWTVEVDQGQMEQVFMNLYVNAWQAMPGGGEIYLETENVFLEGEQAFPYTVKPGKYVKITFTDTGTGMDAKTKERIFDPFFTTKEMGRGTGLGLATVYGIIKGHKGVINVDSELGHGTTFSIYLPASEKEAVKEKAAAGSIARGTETILLVDDEKMVLEVSKAMLESLGYGVYAAGSGQEAIAVYLEKRNEIDLVILDMIMPGISGGETFDRLKEINPDIRVLLSSGYSIEGQARTIMDRGCNAFLQKPFQLEMLSRKVREVLSE